MVENFIKCPIVGNYIEYSSIVYDLLIEKKKICATGCLQSIIKKSFLFRSNFMKNLLREGFNRSPYIKTKVNLSEVIQGFGIQRQLIEHNVLQINCAEDYRLIPCAQESKSTRL